MKYVVILGDGMADYPVPELGLKTPLQSAYKPNIDKLARLGEVGMVKTIPNGIPPGSDAANLSVLGYNPRLYYTGRSPLEAASIGVELSGTDLAMRCNLVTLSSEEAYENKTMVDYSSDEISTGEAAEIIATIQEHFGNELFKYHAGISYRHCLVWKDGPSGLKLTPPHDILERKVAEYLPSGENSEKLLDMMKRSFDILKNHPVNKSRVERDLRPANSIWLWGDGRKPSIPLFSEKYDVKGTIISAVDLLKGIGKCAGMNSVDVEGATGNINTNFRGKGQAVLDELKAGADFVYVHVEAPDESGHRYEIDNKVKSIEMIDKYIAGPVLEGLKQYEDYSILVLPDHPTPLSLRTHTSEPVPYILYRSCNETASGVQGYDEQQAAATGMYIEEGYKLMDRFIKGK